MGYYTQYSLKIYRKGSPINKIDSIDDPFGEESSEDNPISNLRLFSDAARYAIDEDGRCNDSTKWYDHDEDMKKLSKIYYDWVFELHGEGEENGDFWNKYYKNGKVQGCGGKIVYPPYDENKLV